MRNSEKQLVVQSTGGMRTSSTLIHMAFRAPRRNMGLLAAAVTCFARRRPPALGWIVTTGKRKGHEASLLSVP